LKARPRYLGSIAIEVCPSEAVLFVTSNGVSGDFHDI
jgi:hypothetical protein